jgi:hypothetical protein
MGNCAEVVVTANGCCFPAAETCKGDQRTNDIKYHPVECTSAAAEPPPPPSEPASCWRQDLYGDDWCGLNHPGQTSYNENSGAAFAELFGGSWAHDRNNGWRFCGLTKGECMAACRGMGECEELNFAWNGCCFPATRTCAGSARSNDIKLHKVDCVQGDGVAAGGQPAMEPSCETIQGDVGEQQYKDTDFSGACVSLADGVTSIGKQGFEQARFDSIEIPHSVTSIGKQAFKQVNFGESDAVFIWKCDPATGTWPILSNQIDLGQQYLEDTSAVFEYSCAIDINSIVVGSESKWSRPFALRGIVNALVARARLSRMGLG